MRLPDTAHTSRPWRIHELTRDFELVDVWALPTPGSRDDFPRLVHGVAAGSLSRSPSAAVRALWAIRMKVGALLGWDRADAGVGSRVATLRERLHDQMLALTPPGQELELHVNLLRHGRRTCHARSPECARCALARMCPSRKLFV